MLFKIFQLIVLVFGTWVVVENVKDLMYPSKAYPIYRAGEREFH